MAAGARELVSVLTRELTRGGVTTAVREGGTFDVAALENGGTAPPAYVAGTALPSRVASAVNEERKEPADPPVTITLKK